MNYSNTNKKLYCHQKGVHWEKCHTLYYIKKGIITFDALEKVEVMNFRKLP